MNVSVMAAAGAGLLAFLPPGVLPPVPSYLAFAAGVSFANPGTVPAGRRNGRWCWRRSTRGH